MSETDRLIRTVRLTLAAGTAPIDGLKRPEGILDLRAEGLRRIVITYDLRHVTLAAIESWTAANGVTLSNGILSRLHRHWLAFKDDNRRDQAAIVHQCCSVPPRKD